ncbi:MAG TPA: TonB-dependent receptor [Saprospiraceae bacterium]|nr:TonB-dependent receptor [Saprospiraceae bacterium]
MRLFLQRTILAGFMCFMSLAGHAQARHTISGYVKDDQTGETLIGANVYLESDAKTGTVTNTYGFFSMTLPEGVHRIVVSYLGYQHHIEEVNLVSNVNLNINMVQGIEMQEVVVAAKGEEEDENVQSTSMGRVSLPIEQIKVLPALLGEVDILKTIQLLPGVSSAGEGSAGFYVRGGGADQNLVLLDEAVVYNSGHFLGFFSVFNSDAIKNTTLIKGGIPAVYGGRLSSVLDIQMKEGNNQNFQGEGGIGLISSRLTLEGPIVKGKSSFLVSGRRTYGFDLAQPFIRQTDFAGTNYFFYDLNAKMNYQFSQKDRIYLSGYFGRDVLTFAQPGRDFEFTLPYGNATATFRWNHLFTEKLFFNLSAIYNDYQFKAGFDQEEFNFDIFSGVRDFTAKFDFDYFPSNDHQVKTGIHATKHRLTPNIIRGSAGDTEFENTATAKYANEYAIYIQDDWKINPWFRVNLGLRGTLFQQTGPYTSGINGEVYETGEVVQTYSSLEPRIFINTTLNPNASIKAGVTSTTQYLHLVSNSSSTLPADVWVPSSEIVKPQRGWQYAAGYFQNIRRGMYEASIEAYYKSLQDQIDYRESYVDNSVDQVENEFVFGSGEAYGLEFFIRKNSGKLNGWIGYTLSRTDRTFPDIENGRTYPTTYDRTHDLSFVSNYNISPKLIAGVVFVYATGKSYTPPERVYLIDGELQTDYGPRNSQRLEPYHRLDLSLTWIPNPTSKKNFTSEWVFSVYNAYNRQNTFFLYTDYETDLQSGTAEVKAYKVSIFPILPSVTWNFKFK